MIANAPWQAWAGLALSTAIFVATYIRMHWRGKRTEMIAVPRPPRRKRAPLHSYWPVDKA